jgi:hypothetical protein
MGRRLRTMRASYVCPRYVGSAACCRLPASWPCFVERRPWTYFVVVPRRLEADKMTDLSISQSSQTR